MDVRAVAKLAHLQITDEEVALYTPQMADIVSYVEQLNELEADLDGIEPMLGGMTDAGLATETQRADEVRPSLGSDAALSEAPASEAGHFQVPKIL